MIIYVLVAHGSRAEPANSAHRDLTGDVEEFMGSPVLPAFLELAEPDIPSAIESAINRGADSVVVVPHFLAPGNHVGRDIPTLVDQARQRYPQVEISLAPHTGSRPEMAELIAAVATESGAHLPG